TSRKLRFETTCQAPLGSPEERVFSRRRALTWAAARTSNHPIRNRSPPGSSSASTPRPVFSPRDITFAPLGALGRAPSTPRFAHTGPTFVPDCRTSDIHEMGVGHAAGKKQGRQLTVENSVTSSPSPSGVSGSFASVTDALGRLEATGYLASTE